MQGHRITVIHIAGIAALIICLTIAVVYISIPQYINGTICEKTEIHHVYATYIAQPNITIDGVANESVWHQPGVYAYTLQLSNDFEASNPLLQSTMYMKFIYDGSYLYILAQWDVSRIDQSDKALFCWNINCTNYTSCMFLTPNGMETPNPGERVESWQFQATQIGSLMPNNTASTLSETCFDNTGFLKTVNNNDVHYGFTYGTWLNGTNYMHLEMRRQMVTSASTSIPASEVTFKENVPVRFSAAIESNAVAEGQGEHAISSTCDLNLTTNPRSDNYTIPRFQVPYPYATLFIILAIGAGGTIAIIVTWHIIVKKGREKNLTTSTASSDGGSDAR